MSESPLDRCPFCGSDFVAVSQMSELTHVVICEKCEAQGPKSRLTMEEAARLWNERAWKKWKKNRMARGPTWR